MSGNEKMKAKGEQIKGAVKENTGRALGNERMAGEGRAERAKGDAREAKERTKDAFKR
ncbi:CsbD family protein [Streptomyces bikiniensis]|uniref:CsbD family protein n=1 Tax=Streptomyces bikiniensis TaxID=1896 RepID=UPI0004C1948A|nr:CsbD family protein [Streptomyces bikiniensis]